MNLKTILFFVLFFIIILPAYADVTPQDIDNAISKPLHHPYLYFTEQEKPAIQERIKNDPDCKDIMDRLLAEANRLLYTPVETPLPQQFKDSRFDTSGKFLGVYGLYRNAAFNLAFCYQMTGDEHYARKSFEFAKALCDMETWVMRACQFAKAYKRVSPWNVIDDKVVFTYAIIASSTTGNLAAVYDWLYPALNRDERDWIRGALLEKAITQVRGNWEYHWWSTAYRCNWCTWCCHGLGIAALTLLTEDPHLVDVVAEAYNRMNRTLDEFGLDGGWAEGGSYGVHTLRMTLYFGDALKRLTDGKYNMFEHPALAGKSANLGLYLSFPDGKSANIADCAGGRLGDSVLYNKIALETGNKQAAWLRDNRYDTGYDVFDIIWPHHKVKGELPSQGSLHFRTIDWIMMRSDFTDSEHVTIACKAGKNDDPHHGHLDVGQFLINWRGEAFIKDHGAATYDELYFDAEKYDTPQASSAGHNLIFVNGEQQIPGKRFRQPLDENVGGEVLEFRPGQTRDYTLMDPTHAYPGKELKKWRRHIILEKPVITVVVDEVVSVGNGAKIEARFHSDCKQVIGDGYVLLDGDNGDMAIIPVIDGDFINKAGSHTYMAIQKNAQLQRIPYCGTFIHPSGKRTVLAHIILPVEDETETLAIIDSVQRSTDNNGTKQFSFTKNGIRYDYTFLMGNNGLVLE
ncbi:MAG: heparinase II/III family protein [Candidatus Latescibacteria bacterium]|nr:heparinase II/III family protein [Candidatus Latescibacterota bacterium]